MLCTVLVAIIIPYVALLIPLAGAFCGAFLALILPSSMDLYILYNNNTNINTNNDNNNCHSDTNSNNCNSDSNVSWYYESPYLLYARCICDALCILFGILCFILGTIYAVSDVIKYFQM